jgi:hypothetical protein
MNFNPCFNQFHFKQAFFATSHAVAAQHKGGLHYHHTYASNSRLSDINLSRISGSSLASQSGANSC